MTRIKVVNTTWEQDRVSLKEIRETVFVHEQGVSKDLEWDNKDTQAEHFIAYYDGDVVGCARLTDNKKVGRMAVLPAFRNHGVGRELLDHINRHASQRRYTRLELSAQCHAYEFYRRSGYEASSLPYEDANIPHIDMERRVFSHDDQDGSKYQIGFDPKIYHGTSLLEAKGFLDICLSQSRRTLVLCIKDITHPIFTHENLLDQIKRLAKENKHFKTYILLGSYHPTFNDHALFKLADKLPSFIEIKTTQEAIPCQWIIDSTAWFDFEGADSRICYSDRGKIKNFMERFNKWWNHSKHIQDARRLSI